MDISIPIDLYLMELCIFVLFRKVGKLSGNCSGTWSVSEALSPKAKQTEGIQMTSMKMNMQDCLLLIPQFDGRPECLEPFSASLRHISTHFISSVEQRSLILALHTKLRSQAYDHFAHRLHQIDTIENLISELHLFFGEAGRKSELLDRLYKIRQEPHESVREFGLKVDILMERTCLAYSGYRISNDVQQEVEDTKMIVRRTALASFIRGLTSMELEVHVSMRRPETLHEAIGVAIELDNLRSLTCPNFQRKCESAVKTKRRNNTKR
ncbi:hypothetical protein QAD02_017920 [Eretmocerus hayati]|uniref:Uncharacterized protein n=1 Tax=Eretmocerus hayati TaxID=131215 RepID=A0ACC2PGC3_9HYME|nr:hypothetical protein QAD02_017920 [Eretmocerus hayati]